MSSSNDKNTSAQPPKFEWSQLWRQPIINPVNLKSYTLPILNLNNPYSRSFHLSWRESLIPACKARTLLVLTINLCIFIVGFFTAFLAWFAFPPLIPDAISNDLKLTPAQISTSNIIALTATLVVRLFVGPLVDRYGPRKVMAGLLIAGAIPSGLAGTAHNAQTLYVVRFFIGILGGTFVPCQAWTSTFFDTSCVGRANALVAGWGSLYLVSASLFSM